MAKFCSECGTQIPENALFCPECGKEHGRPNEPKPQDTAPPTPQTVQPAAPEPQPVQPAAPKPPSPSPSQPALYPAVGTGAYFGLMLLFALPVIGVLLCIIISLASKNKSLKNFAKATLIWIVIGLVISGLIIALFSFMSGPIITFFKDIAKDVSAPLQETFGGLGELQELTDAMGEISGSVTETMPIE